MSLQTYSKVSSANTVNATTVVTGLGFKPKAILFYTRQATSGSFICGMSDGVNNSYCGVSGQGAVSTTVQSKASSSTKCLAVLTNGSTTVTNEAVVASFDVDGFTLTWNSTPAAAYEIGFVAWGGSDITNVLVGNDTMRTTAGTKANTAPGFKPDMLFLMSIPVTAAGSSTNSRMTVGMASGAANRFALGLNAVTAATMTTTFLAKDVVNTAACLHGLTAGAVTELVADLSSFDATGFTLNYTTAPATAYIVYYMAIKGGTWSVGNTTRPAGGGSQSISDLPFRSQGSFFLGCGNCTATNTISTDMDATAGGANGSVSGVQAMQTTNTIPTVANSIGGNGSITSLPGGTVCDSTYTSNDATGFTINWSNPINPGTLMLLGYAAFGDSFHYPLQDDCMDGKVMPDLQDNLALNAAFMAEYWDTTFGGVIGPQTYNSTITATLTAAVALANTMVQLASASAAATLAAVESPNLSIPAANSAALTAAATQAAKITFSLSTTAALTAALAQTTQVAFAGSIAGSGTAGAVLAPALQIPTANNAALTAAYVAAPGLVVAQTISASGTLNAVQGAGLVIPKSIAASGVLAAVESAQLSFSLSISAAGTLAAVESAKLSAAGSVTGGLTAALALATRTTFVGAASAALNSTAAAATVVVMNSTIAPSLLAATFTAGTIAGGGTVYNVNIAQALVAALAAQATYSVPGSVAASIAPNVILDSTTKVVAAAVGALSMACSTVGARATAADIVGATINVCDMVTEPLELSSSITATAQISATALASQTYVDNVVVLQTLNAAFPFFITGSSAGVQAQTVAQGSTNPAMDVTGGVE